MVKSSISSADFLNTFIRDSRSQIQAAQYITGSLAGLISKNKLRLSNASFLGLENVESTLAALLCKVRHELSLRFPEQFCIRDVKRVEYELLETTIADLNLKGGWKDHIGAVDVGPKGGPIPKGPALISEPYQLGAEDFRDFLLLENAGWKIHIYQSFATHFPGKTVCVVLQFPTPNGKHPNLDEEL